MNDRGSFDIFCEIVEESELQEILDDMESEMEDGDTTDGNESDAEDSFDEYKAGNDLKEDKDPCWKGYEMIGMKKKGGRKVPNCVPKNESINLVKNVMEKKKLAEDQLNEGRPSQRHPLEGHEYHRKSDAELTYIGKDAHKAAEAMKGHNEKAEGKYLDQANDAATVRHFRKRSGMPKWYKEKYGHNKK
jgi:hypothetical protein